MSTKDSHQHKQSRRPAAERRPLTVTPRRRTEIDPQMMALVYFLIASRIVREAKEAEEAAARPATTADDPSGGPEVGETPS
jgi:hypothetical protein